MLRKLLKYTLLFSICILSLAVTSRGQTLQDMTFADQSGTFNFETALTYNMGAGDDNVYSVPLPFSFKWDGTYQTNMYISDNGYLVFSPYNNYYYYYSTYLTDIWPSVQAMTSDLYVNGSMNVAFTGAAPNRVAVVQWQNTDFYYGRGANMNFQIKLYETSNKVEICYGSMNFGSFWSYYVPKNGFVGNSNSSYINLEPGATFTAHYSSRNASPNYNLPYLNTSNASNYTNGKVLVLSSFPSMVGTYPTQGTILQRGNVYTGSQHPSISFSRISGQAEVYAYYKISGPLPASNPDFKTIYTGTKVGNPSDELIYFSPQPIGTPGIANIPAAKGIAANTTADLDLSTNATSIPGGEYIVESSMYLPNYAYLQSYPTQTFVIALANDLAISTFNSPVSNDIKKYPQTASIPVQCKVQNIGINDVYEFGVRINFLQNGSPVYTDSVHWSNTTPLHTGDFVNVTFASFKPRAVGDYQVKVQATLLSANDDEMKNNYFPRAGQPDYYFTIAYEIEAEAYDVIAPSDTVYVKRPVLPIARYRNNGVSDMSDIPASMYIVRLPAMTDTVFKDNITVQDIPSGKPNTTDAYFSSNFIPQQAGQYKVCITINSPDDPVISNNTFCKTITVIDAMAGTYTIGSSQSGPRNFATFTDALNALYLKGLTGPVVFELTDDVYNVGDINLIYPALDISGAIIGASSTNTITFRPSSLKAVARNSVLVNLNSAAGIGVLLGQNVSPYNSNAAAYTVTSVLKKVYARTGGYITFDGGSQKSLRFRLNSGNAFRAAFYLAEGANNMTVKNCLIEDGSPTTASTIPLTRYDVTNSRFTYEANVRSGNVSYSNGILLRSMPPFDKGSVNSNILHLDTMACQYNTIKNNEIQGFGFGITSIGIGPLQNGQSQAYMHFYNNHNEISYNQIYNISRAGIYLGHEENSNIKFNKIYTIGGTSATDAAGIMAGGEGNSSYNGYNNIGVNINGNEISNVNSTTMTYGIKVEQSKNGYPYLNPTTYYFPDVPENMTVSNNAIWGLNITNGAASRVGIHLMTSRVLSASDWLTKMITPKDASYWSRNDVIVNNTVRIPWDGGLMNSGAIAGIAVQQAKNAVVLNNAISLEDNDVLSTNPLYAGIFYQGIFPGTGIFRSDRNAFWYTPGSGASVYRFIEMDAKNNFIDTYSRDEYKTLSQWQQWTKQDRNSVFGNFTGDLTLLGNEPNQRLRVITAPQTPLGSILNNRGELFSANTNDIDGNPRGSAGQRYDIGASEFTGRMYITDVEGLYITAPGAYKANVGTFADAEYIMTKAPVEVKAMVRNNGNIAQYGVTCTVKAYRELPNNTFSTTPEITKTAVVDMQASESAEVAFKLADFVGLNFYPKTYSDLTGLGYIIPDQFTTMSANITPRYKIEIGIQADQNNANNVFSKVVRFYLLRSDTRICISAENSMTTLSGTSTADQIAGRLNYDSVRKVLTRFGWKIDVNADPPVYNYDIFDRLGWEPKAVNYTNFRTVLWSDGDDKATTRFQRADIRNFLSYGSDVEKKNFIAGSQEFVRKISQNDANNDVTFLNDIMRAANKSPENPLGLNGNNNGNKVIGLGLERNLSETIKSTGVTNDPNPFCGLMGVTPSGEGLALPAYYYTTRATGVVDSIMGVGTTTLSRNVIILGVDWRHWTKGDMVFRAAIDFIEKNGGTIIPVELLSFDAVAAGNRVDMNWTTASEYNTDKFEIEKATVSNTGNSDFVKIGEEKAAGKSEVTRHYGPFVDRNVEFGNRYIYRLKMLDADGKYTYSNQVEVAFDASGSWLSNVSPNPAVSNASFIYSIAQEGNICIDLYDLTGKKMMNVFNGFTTAGEHPVSIDVNMLTNGSYNLIMTAGNQSYIKQIQIAR